MKPNGIAGFWRRVTKTAGCWLWIGATDKDGYGRFNYRDTVVGAHRFAYESERGPIPPGACVLHRCDNPPCVNPEHLFLGFHSDNVHDRDSKGRQVQGERAHLAKLNKDRVKEIRRLYSMGGLSQQRIGEMFGVTQATVGRIVRRVFWARVA